MHGHAPSVDLCPDRLQDGIYVRADQQASPSYCLLLLNIPSGATRYEAREAITTVWTMLQNLRRGVVRDLQPRRPFDPDLRVPGGGLTCLLGFGARLFDPQYHNPPLVSKGRGLEDFDFLERDGVEAPFPKLNWAAEEERTSTIGEADLALQLIAETELAVSRAVVEVWKIISDKRLKLQIVTFHGGFKREDARSWLDFHDCISNLEPSQRRTAIEVILKEPPWMEGGTYMAFLRLAIDLAAWRSLRREHQEIMVGRDKLTGCPLEKVNRGRYGELIPVPLGGCPLSSPPAGSPAYINPPPPEEPLLQASHIHRSNLNREGPEKGENNRIYRQSYEFVEPLADGRLRLGLNFVSFQHSLSRLINILNSNVWLGDVNFGGPKNITEGLASVALLSVIAGGYYAVPPKGEPFPGAELF